MISAEMHDAKAFANFLNIISRFVSLGTFIIDGEKTVFYAINPTEFPSTRLEMETNLFTLCPNSSIKIKKEENAVTSIKMSFDELNKFKSTMEIMDSFYKRNEFILNIEASTLGSKGSEADLSPGMFIVKKLFIKEENCAWDCFCVEENAVKRVVMQKVNRDLEHKINFNIDPSHLNLIQSKTSNFVDLERDGSIYIYPDKKFIKIELGSRNVAFANKVILNLSESYEGTLIDTETPEIIIHKTGYEILNILRSTEKDALHCGFSPKFKVMEVTSEMNDENGKWWIKSRILTSQVKGK